MIIAIIMYMTHAVAFSVHFARSLVYSFVHSFVFINNNRAPTHRTIPQKCWRRRKMRRILKKNEILWKKPTHRIRIYSTRDTTCIKYNHRNGFQSGNWTWKYPIWIHTHTLSLSPIFFFSLSLSLFLPLPPPPLSLFFTPSVCPSYTHSLYYDAKSKWSAHHNKYSI